MYFIPDTPHTLESREDSPRRNRIERAVISTGSTENTDSGSGKVANDKEKNVIKFAKSQAALQVAYNKRMEIYNQLPLRVRVDTGKNLKNLQPLAVRNAEFC